MTMTAVAPTVLDDDRSEALFREARRRRWRRWIIGLVGLALVGAGVGLARGGAGSAGGGQLSSQVVAATGDYQPLEHPSKLTTAAMLDWFFPTSGADFAAGWRFLNAFDAVETGAVSQCLAAKGFHFPTSSPQIVYSGDNTEFPYLSYLGTHGFGPTLIGTSVATDPTKGMTQAEMSAYKAATHGCRTTISAVFDPALQSGSTLQDQWMSIVAKIDTEAPFQRALDGWRTCTQHAGVNVSTIQAFFSYADSQRVHGGGLQDPSVSRRSMPGVSLQPKP
jgi:hypothetical protein